MTDNYKSLFNEYNAVSYDHPFDKELDSILIPLFKRYVEEGYNPREISHWIICCVTAIESQHVIRNAMDKRRGKRNAIQNDDG
jgi:hypothetical protein